MNSTGFYKTFLKIAVPLILQQFLTVALNFADNLMIGKLGEASIVSVGFSNKYYMVFSIVLFGIYSGCSIFMSQFYGKQNFDILKKIFGLMVLIGLFFCAIFTFVGVFFPEFIIKIFSPDPEVIRIGASYLRIIAFSFPMTAISVSVIMSLRAMGKTLPPLIISCFAILTNVALNYALINGKFGMPRLGVDGAAYATTIARTLEMILYIILITVKGYNLKGNIKSYFGLKKETLSSIIKVSTPVILTEILWILGTTALTVAYAKSGTDQSASVQIGELFLSFATIVFMGIANSSSIIIGQSIGSGSTKGALNAARKVLRIAFIFSIFSVIFIQIITKPMLGFYTLKPEVMRNTILVIRVLGIAVFFKMINWTILIGILRAGGDTKVAFFYDTAFLIGYAVPIAFLGTVVFRLPIYQVVILANLEEVIKFIFAVKRYKSKKWMHDLTSITS